MSHHEISGTDLIYLCQCKLNDRRMGNGELRLPVERVLGHGLEGLETVPCRGRFIYFVYKHSIVDFIPFVAASNAGLR